MGALSSTEQSAPDPQTQDSQVIDTNKMDDARGITRGRCKRCLNCGGYNPPASSLKCVCGCPPAAHTKIGSAIQVSTGNAPLSVSPQMPTPVQDPGLNPPTLTLSTTVRASLCTVPGCNQLVDFDIHSGQEYVYCNGHLAVCSNGQGPLYVQDIEMNDSEGQQNYSGNPYAIAASPLITGTPAQVVPKDSSMCIIPECQKPKYVDPNSGATHDYCGRTHADEGKRRGITSHTTQDGCMDTSVPLTTAVPGQPQPPPTQGVTHLPSGVPKCAISECSNPCFVDESGTVHECCGITHAMEHQRRQALWQQVNQQVVKGVTHCLLPECNRHTWPFENYCGRTHADIGIQRGLVPPPSNIGSPAQAGPKDSSTCIIPECQKPKYVDPSSGATHDYCGRTHADEGKKRGIVATTDKVEQQCDLPGCSNRKRTEGTHTYDYCCQDHSKQDAPNRDANILTSHSEVQNFLKKFPNLKVASLTENVHSKPGGVLFNKFKTAMMSLPQGQRQTCLAFHGTNETSIDSICRTGYDPKRRSGQAYGTGEYFATSPTIPLGYCKGGKKMLLNELLLGQNGTHHTKHGDIVVMKNPSHDLPRYVITFK